MSQISAPLSAEIETLSEALSLLEAFRAFDADNDERITAAELGGILGSLGYKASEQDVRAMMLQGDTDKDGLLSVEEFMELNTRNMELGGLANSLRAVFEAFVVDDDVAVTGDELFQVMENMGLACSLEECRDIIASIDADGDGAVTFEDFKLILNALL
uniref:Putative calcium-binding protein CML29 n=1 Tax=Rhizophora mucronata TaxID=61149 RepID=A0A2P2MZ56_RHIMU